MRDRDAPRVAIVGTGRMAGALAEGLTAAGWPVVAVAGRRRAAVRRLATRTRGAVGTTSLGRAAGLADVILLAVSDRAIAPVAVLLAGGREPLEHKTVLHHAGALGPEPLAPLESLGAFVGVLHPLQTIGKGARQFALLEGCRARIEGGPRAVAPARRLARALGMIPLRLPRRMTPCDRVAYHAAASLVSNDLVGLFAIAVELVESLGVSRRESVAALLPLAAGALTQLDASGVTGAMTGPVARGDAETLGAHLDELSLRSADAAAVHRALSRVLLRLRGGGATGRADRERLRRALDSPAGGRRRGPGV